MHEEGSRSLIKIKKKCKKTLCGTEYNKKWEVVTRTSCSSQKETKQEAHEVLPYTTRAECNDNTQTQYRQERGSHNI
jgi:hypothetical protein